MTPEMRQILQEVGQQFQIEGQFIRAEMIKVGHINETYATTCRRNGKSARYVHQTINEGVFKDPVALMGNVVKVTTHLRERLLAEGADQIERRALRVISTSDGKSFHRDARGKFWRTFDFIERVQTFDAVKSPEQAYQAGLAFGHFQNLLVDLPSDSLVETIPDFHNTRKRFTALQAAIAEDRFGRAAEGAGAIGFALGQEPLVDVLLQARAAGEIPERITHNDTKFNNVMLDAATGQGMCVVDLDTVMPGLVLYDFGDMVRTTTSRAPEDETDLEQVEMEMPMFEELARGYVEAARGFLTPAEKSYLVFSGKLITFTIGIRFLTDFLNGDEYFRIHRPAHNLDRARKQFKLVESITRQEGVMQRFVESL